MALFLSSIQVLGRRSLANWRLLAGLAMGVFVAITAMSSAPVYLNAVTQSGLSHDVTEQEVRLLDLQVYTPTRPVNGIDSQKAQGLVDHQLDNTVGNLVREKQRFARTLQDSPFVLGPPGSPRPVGDEQRFGVFQFITGLENHVTVLQGRFFALGSGQPSDYVEVVVGQESARTFNFKVEQSYLLYPTRAKTQEPIPVKIVGIVEPIDFNEEYWLGHYDMFLIPGDDINEVPPKATFFVTEEGFLEDVGKRAPGLLADYWWFLYITPEMINSRNASQVDKSLEELRTGLSVDLPRSTVFTALVPLFDRFQTRLFYTKIPLVVLTVLIVGVAVYYVLLMAGTLIDRQRKEITLLISRGASVLQVVVVYLAQGVILALPALVIGPLIGAAIIALLGKTPAFSRLSGGDLLPVYFTPAVFILALGGALSTILALALPAYLTSRRRATEYAKETARPIAAPFFQRYYIDLFLVVLGGFIFWELKQREALFTREVFGAIKTDQVLLAAPILFVLAVITIVLRAFPIVIGLISRLASPFAGLWAVLGLWQMVRNPVHYVRLILLLTLVVTLGMFVATFGGTMVRSFNERVLYSSGSDIRLTLVSDIPGARAKDFAQRYSEEQGVKAISTVYRTSTDAAVGSTVDSFTALGIDPRTFSEVAWFREDFSDQGLTELVKTLGSSRSITQGLDLPKDSQRLGVWARPNLVYQDVSLSAWLRDGNGVFQEVRLGEMDFDQWRFLEVPLSSITQPITVHALYFRDSSFGGVPRDVTVLLDDLQVAKNLESTVVEDFENLARWVLFQGPVLLGDTFSLNPERVEGVFSAEFSVKGGRSSDVRGVYYQVDPGALPVVVSSSFPGAAEGPIGSISHVYIDGVRVTVEVKGVADFFPTMGVRQQDFIIFNLNHLLYYANLFPGGRQRYSNELWISTTQDGDSTTNLLEKLRRGTVGVANVQSRLEMTEEEKLDPFVVAGFDGLRLITLGVIVVVGVLGYLGFSWLNMGQRNLDFATMNGLGVSFKEVLRFLALEQGIVVGTSLLIGALTGHRVTFLLTDFFEHNEVGRQVIPPFLLTVDWQVFGIVALAILAVLFLASLQMGLQYLRVPAHRILRSGEG